jgi:hypothetical protein
MTSHTVTTADTIQFFHVCCSISITNIFLKVSQVYVRFIGIMRQKHYKIGPLPYPIIVRGRRDKYNL